MESKFVHPYVANMDIIDSQPNPWMRPTLPYHYNMDLPYYGYTNGDVPLFNVAQKGEKDIANDEVRPDVYSTVKKMINPFPLWRQQTPPEIRTWDDGPKHEEFEADKKVKKEAVDMDDKDIMNKHRQKAESNWKKGKEEKKKMEKEL